MIKQSADSITNSYENPNYDGFSQLLEVSSKSFAQIPKNKGIRIIGHLDADGICASAIIINALIKLNRKYSLTTLPTISEETLKDISNESEEYLVFVDLGSGNIDSIGKILTNKTIYILDHHQLQSEKKYENITQINPHIFNIDGSIEISGSGVVFMFTQYLTNKNNNEMSKIALVGAIGDIQETNGFKKLNNDILNIAIENKLVEVKRGLRFFGVQTKPIYKLLQYSSDIIIPGVNGSESGAIKFLTTLGINPKTKTGWRKISDLNSEEQQKLVAGIIEKRVTKTNTNSSDIFNKTYLLIGENEDTPFRDAKEFATLLNSCGRLNKSSIGIGACLNDRKMKEMAIQNLSEYRKELVTAINWYKENANTERIIRKKNYLIINAEDDIMPTIIGTLGSILSKSQDIEKNTFILSLARNHDDTTKISLRIVGNPDNTNLKEIVEQMITQLNHGSSGGHSFAAGAVIDTEKENEFLKIAQEILADNVITEKL
jgi:RecJ-like exonuclease